MWLYSVQKHLLLKKFHLYRGLFKINDDKKFLRIDMGGFFIPKSHWEDQEAEEFRDKEWCEKYYQDGPDNTE